MKTALLLFNNPSAQYPAEYVGKITACLYGGGYPVDSLETLSISSDLGFKRSLEKYKDTVDNLIVVAHPELTFDAKQVICDTFDTVLIENDNALKFVNALSTAHATDYGQAYAMMPENATLIPNLTGAFQGFIMENDGFSLVVLPWAWEELSVACERYLLPYFDKKFANQACRMTLKYFGETEPLISVLKQAEERCAGVKSSVENSYGDHTIKFISDNEQSLREAVRIVLLNLKENVYAECQSTLSQRVFDLLKLKKMKIATAESFTGGRIVSSLVSNAGASAVVHEGVVCYSNQSKIERTGIASSDLEKEGAVSSMTAYRMAAGLLKTGNIDVAVSTTGIAGPFGDGSNAPVGLCYVGVGMKDGVHTYKLNLNGSREEITETAKNTALFLTFKKLKSID